MHLDSYSINHVYAKALFALAWAIFILIFLYFANITYELREIDRFVYLKVLSFSYIIERLSFYFSYLLLSYYKAPF